MKNQTRTRHALLMACTLTSLALTTVACNTVQGVGEDISSVGRKGEEIITD